MVKHLQCVYISVWLICLPFTVLASSKIDSIYFQGGDRITGEVKSLENDLLRISTEDAGTIKIEWGKVDSVHILNVMRILLEDGEVLYGVLLPSGVSDSSLIWHRDGDPRLVSLDRIVELSPIGESFINRLNGSVSSGFSYAKATGIMTINLDGSLQYRADKNFLELNYEGNFTNDEVSGNSQRQKGGAMMQRVLPKKWFLLAQLDAETNSEQKLDLRTSVGLGGGNSIIRTNSTHFYTAGGILLNREDSEEINQYNVEGILAANYSIFIYDAPEVSFNINGSIIPSLNHFGRIRSEIASDLKWEILDDLFVKWTFYYSFDSEPLNTSGEAEKSDWAITMLGLEFKF